MCSVYVAFGAVGIAIENTGEPLSGASAVDFAWLLPQVRVYSIISLLRACPRYDPLKVITSALKRTCSGRNVFSEYLSKAVRCSKSMGVKNMQVKCFAGAQTLFARVILLIEVCPIGWSCLFGCPRQWVSEEDMELVILDLLFPALAFITQKRGW